MHNPISLTTEMVYTGCVWGYLHKMTWKPLCRSLEDVEVSWRRIILEDWDFLRTSGRNDESKGNPSKVD